MRNLIQLTIMVAVSVSATAASAQQGAASDERLIEWLRSSTPAVRHAAVAHVLAKTTAEGRSAALEQALVSELQRVNADFTRRWQTSRAGQPLEGDFPAEYHFDLIEAVSQSSNSITIPALAGALGTGRRVQEALAKFGEQAVPHVLPIAQRARPRPELVTEPPSYVLADAVGALALVMERSRETLTTASRAALTQVARARLAGRQEPGVIAAACALAIATGEPDLRQRVQELATSRAQLTAMGIADDPAIRLIQMVAARELRKR